MGLNVLFSIWFSKLFAQIGLMPVGGLALANSLATALEAAALFIFIRKRLDGIEGRTILDGLWRISLGGLVMAVSLIAWNQIMDGTNRWVAALGGVVLGGLIYFVVVTIVKVPEIKFVTDAVVNRLRR
jgi:putative peptidoglycan lipid II flippase